MISHTGESVLISIADEGIGFHPSDSSTLFQPFFRGSNAGNFPGSGVGLSITEKIIQMHKGTVEAALNEGKGACFHINLPINSGF